MPLLFRGVPLASHCPVREQAPVRTSRFSSQEREQILRQGYDRASVQKVCERFGISVRTFYRWQSLSAHQKTVVASRMRDLERENRRLKQKFAELSLDYHALRAALVKEGKAEC